MKKHRKYCIPKEAFTQSWGKLSMTYENLIQKTISRLRINTAP